MHSANIPADKAYTHQRNSWQSKAEILSKHSYIPTQFGMTCHMFYTHPTYTLETGNSFGFLGFTDSTDLQILQIYRFYRFYRFTDSTDLQILPKWSI